MEPNWTAAVENARRITELEQVLSLGWESQLQAAFLALPGLVHAMNVFYFVGHFVLTGLFFLWLYHRSRRRLPPLPRRLPRRDADLRPDPLEVPDRAAAHRRSGVLDTLCFFSGIDIGSPTTRALTNPAAAVPSLHAGYALGVGLGVFRFARSGIVRAAGLVYPLSSS